MCPEMAVRKRTVCPNHRRPRTWEWQEREPNRPDGAPKLAAATPELLPDRRLRPNYSRTGRRGLLPAGVGMTVPVSGCAGSSHRSWVDEPDSEAKTIRPSESQPASATFAGFGDNRRITPVATVSVKSATSPSRVEMNAIVPPSGLHAGFTSVADPSVSEVSEPSATARRASDALPNWVVTTTRVSSELDQLGLASSAVANPALPVAAVALLPSIADVQRWSAPPTGEMNASVVPSAVTEA